MRSARHVAMILLLAAGASASTTTYTLKWGDTLGKVAARYRIPVEALTAVNGIRDPNRVREGQTLKVPDRRSAMVAIAKPISSVSTAKAADGSQQHEVKAGETLSGIATRYGTTVAQLRAVNGLKESSTIREGRFLKLPASAKLAPAAAAAAAPAASAPVCPVKGAEKFDFSNSFGAPRHGGRAHAGNDIFAKRGTPVVASVDGTISQASGSITGIGYYLEGDDGVTYYGAHMDSLRVAKGRVAKGDVIGSVGTTGNAYGTPPHLHFEVKPRGGASIDPYPLLRAWCR